MNVVIDASAAVGLVLAHPAAEIFFSPLEQAALVTAPDLFVPEICNALWKYRKADLLTMTRCESALEHAISLPDRLESSTHLHLESFALSCRYLHPVYDALYLVLARRTNAVIITLDHRLASLAGKLEIETICPSA
jgi:predicted nucleic acid-binding protein